jgi:hypothetical protein
MPRKGPEDRPGALFTVAMALLPVVVAAAAAATMTKVVVAAAAALRL